MMQVNAQVGCKNYTIEPENVKLLDVLSIEDITDPISKTIMTDPIELIPCGHYVDQQENVKWYIEKQQKICPLCSKDYTSMRVNEIFKNLLTKCRLKIQQPSTRLREAIDELCKNLPDSLETQQVKEAIGVFFEGQLTQGLERITFLIITSPNGQLYRDIFNLMNQHITKVSSQSNNPHYIKELEDIKLLDVLSIKDMICHLSKDIMTDPIELIPCGHYVDQQENVKSYRGKRQKICPSCSKGYTSIRTNEIFKKILTKFILKIQQPEVQLRQEIDELCKNFSVSPETQKLKEAIDIFFEGQITKGLELFTFVLMASPNDKLYMDIFNLMNQHVTQAGARKVALIRTWNIPKPIWIIDPRGEAQNSASPEAVQLEGGEFNGDSQTPSLKRKSSSESSSQSGSRKRMRLNFKTQDIQKVVEIDLDMLDQELSSANATQPVLSENEEENQVGIYPEVEDDTEIDEQIDNNEEIQENDSPEQCLINGIKNKEARRFYTYLKNVKNINVQDENGNTPLHLVILHFKKVENAARKLLTKHNANIDAQNLKGETPLYLAAKQGNGPVLLLLLTAGASKKIAAKDGLYPKDVAENSSDQELLQF